jgi:hypothetical protein
MREKVAPNAQQSRNKRKGSESCAAGVVKQEKSKKVAGGTTDLLRAASAAK